MKIVQWVQPMLLALGLVIAFVVMFSGRQKVATEKFGVMVTKTKLSARPLRRGLAIAAGTVLLTTSLAIVPAGYRGVVYSAAGGVSPNERPEGFSFLIPLVQQLVPVDVRTQRYFTDKAYAQSDDLQEITVHVSVNYRIDPTQAAELYRAVGKGYAETVVGPAVLQLVKERVGLIEAADFAGSRAALASDIRDALTAQLAGYGIDVDFVNIEDAVFDPAFIQAVKEKVIADQEAAEQQRLIEAEAAKKEQAILQAEGRAASIRIEADAQADANARVAATLTPDLLSWAQIQQWNGTLPTTVVTDGTSNLLVQVK